MIRLVRRMMSTPPPVSSFDDIYNSNYWNGAESLSGPGSSLEQTETIRRELPLLFHRHGITNVLDVPCGDFKWMSQVDLGSITYIGGDLVDTLVENNNGKFSKHGVSFQVMDLRHSQLPKVDLILCRDCLVHMSYADIWLALRTIVESGSTFLLTTSFTNKKSNWNIKTGLWRPINLALSPFELPPPVEVINENCTEGDKMEHKDKSLLLFRISDLKGHVETLTRRHEVTKEGTKS
jgi:hypothetical protein